MSKGFASTYRIVLLAAGMMVCFSALGARLVYLHVIDRDELVRYVDRARRQIIVENARRGDILDAHGKILATSRTLIVLGVDPQSLRPEDEKKWPQLASLIGIPPEELRRVFLTKSRPAVPVTTAPVSPAAQPEGLVISFSPAKAAAVTAAITPPAPAADEAKPADDTVLDDNADEQGARLIRWAKLSEAVEESTYAKIQALDVRGVYGQRVFRRAYPHDGLAAHVVGYVNKEGEAVAGIERYADFFLHGRDGWREGERDGLRRELAQFRTRDVPPSDGYAVTLSIDSNIQYYVEQELAGIAKQYQPEKATIIVSDPKTGFILAMANYPSFNLNEYNRVPKEQEAAMRNVAVTDEYEPGSVFKIVAASAALNEHAVTPGMRFDCGLESIEYRGRVRSLPRDDHHYDHALSVSEIIAKSSNKGAAQLAMRVGETKFYEYARQFGFGQKTGFPVGGEVDGSMAAPADWDGLTITRMPMGHAIAATALQMQMAMSVIASGGYLVRPQIISQIADASGEVVYRYGPVVKQRVISEETAHTMAHMLEGVATKDGTAPEAAIPNFEVAGKTGTTQKLVRIPNPKGGTKLVYSTTHHVASFVGFLPASRPRVVISVIVDDADAHAPNGVAYGAKVAAPSFKHIAEKLITYLDIKPVYDTTGRSVLAMEGGRR